jgi:hypothetical protein
MTGHFRREAYGQSFFIGTLMNTHGRWIFSFERLADVRKNCSNENIHRPLFTGGFVKKNYPRFGRESNV